jgi:haloacid dehalogenase superfamily, subfamily IA, variant 1 with third motif having Dx(3-4)D or Dx(3-4)E
LSEKGALQFVVTHRDQSIHELVKQLNIDKYFKEVISADDGHKRKPDPEMLDYLISKYGLKRNHLWVIGDRQIDVDFGKSVSANTILLNANKVDFDYDNKVADLLDIKQII